jgi:hypothetical protein
MKRCTNCKTNPSSGKSAVIAGKYYPDICNPCLTNGLRQPHDAAFMREREREDSAKEIIQPFNADGSVNQDFAYAYPDQAEDMFGKDQLTEVG